jgi:hypothetical protein
MLSLRDLQSRFFYSIARPARSASEEWRGFDPHLLSVIEPRRPLGPADRLDIYAQMYCARLLDALGEDFPRVAAVIGEERFRALGREYLRHSPSSHPSLRHLGARFPEFLLSQTETPVPQFMGDLARLEWARVTVFDAPDVEVLRLDDLQAIPAEAWATIRFQVIPALEVLTCARPVQRVWQDEDFTESDAPLQERTTLRIWRREFAVYHARMDTSECAALTAMQAGEPFAAVCTAVEPRLGPADDIATIIGGVLLRWIEDGIIARTYLA